MPKRRSRKLKMTRMTLSIPEDLLVLVDEAAEKDFTNRSDVIRTAILWYLRPLGRDLDQADPEAIIKTLKRRQTMAAYNKFLKEEAPHLDSYDD